MNNLNIINFALPKTGNFFADVILWLCNISSSIVVGIVLFTLLLKIITLPFDFVSRSSMRKNSLKMEEMRPELEKLQKQYANDKDLYNQKMMALYKKNGYSMFGSCLPTIITLVIFIIALNGFTQFSQFQNRQYFYEMSNAFNNVVYAGMELDGNEEYITRNSKGALVIDYQKLFDEFKGSSPLAVGSKDIPDTNISVEYKVSEIFFDSDATINEQKKEQAISDKKDIYNREFLVKTANGYVVAVRNFSYSNYTDQNDIEGTGEFTWGAKINYNTSKELLENTIGLATKENHQLINSKGETFTEFYATLTTAEEQQVSAKTFLEDIQQEMSKITFRSQEKSFLWVKNVWVTDSPMSHPIESSWAKFRDTHAYPTTSANNVGSDNYKLLIGHLDFERTAPNGYFILVVLTAGISLLMQVVMSKSQKAQMELQTVDGQGAQTQKIMTVMMPIMMAVFAFMYTSAFSIYIILSNIMSMGTTFGINKIVDHKFKKEKEKQGKDETKIRGRVYTPKEEPKKEPEKKSKKSKKKEEEMTGFLSGKADKSKHIRGRLK